MSKKIKINLVFNISCKRQTREYLAGIADSLMTFTPLVIHRTNSSCLNMVRALEDAKSELTNKNLKNMRFDGVKMLMVKMGHLKVPYIEANATIRNCSDSQFFVIDKEMKKIMEEVLFSKINEVLQGFAENIMSISLIE